MIFKKVFKIPKIRHFGRICWLIFITVDISIRTVVQHWRGPQKMTREWSDATIQRWGARLLNAAKVNLQVFRTVPISLKPGTSYIIMCNHTSHFDIPISLAALSGWSVRMMAKKELYHIPVFGKAMLSADFPMIDRQNRRQSLKDLAHARDLMKTGIIVWIAPEGTRSTTGTLGEFKRGAFVMAIDAKAMIIPVAIKGAHDILPAKTLGLNINQQVDFFVGEPIDASQYTSKQKDILLEKVRSSIAHLLA